MFLVVVLAVGRPVQEDVVALAHGHHGDRGRLGPDGVDQRLRDLGPVLAAQDHSLEHRLAHQKPTKFFINIYLDRACHIHRNKQKNK